MRIITHNMLQCNIRGVTNGYPLIIQPERTEIIAVPFDKGKASSMRKLVDLMP